MGYDPDRFDHADDFWLCKICQQILKDPVLVCTSHHLLCCDCVSIAAACPWPNCEETMYDADFKRDLNAARFIDTLIISCEDCDWHGPVASEAKHAADCAGRNVQCPNMNCAVTTAFGSLSAHLDVCPEGVLLCANSPDCTHKSRRAEVIRHILNCEFNPCRWQAAGCGFRGSTTAVAAHEMYCTEVHEELSRLRAVAKEAKKAERMKRREERRVDREAAQEQAECEEAEARKEEKARRREERRAARAVSKVAEDYSADLPTLVTGAMPLTKSQAAVSPQANGNVSRLPRGVSASSADHASARLASDPGTTAAASDPPPSPPTSVDPSQVYEPSSLYPLPSPANSVEDRHYSRDTPPAETMASGHDTDSIASSYESAAWVSKGGARTISPAKDAEGPQDGHEVLESAETSTPAKKPSSMKKRSWEDAGVDSKSSTGPGRKKVRIRLPSPFLQPDTDEEEEDTAYADAQRDDWGAGVGADGGGDGDSDDLEDLVVTSIAKPSEEVEVEESINVAFYETPTPTPASLLAKYHASKPVYMQEQYISPGRGHGFLDAEYPDFPMPPLLCEMSKSYNRSSMSVSPVMRSNV